MDKHNEFFEDDIKQAIEGYKMYPSAKVWDTIQDNLSSKKKPTFIALITLVALTIISINTNTSSSLSYNDTGITSNAVAQQNTSFIEQDIKPIATAINNISSVAMQEEKQTVMPLEPSTLPKNNLFSKKVKDKNISNLSSIPILDETGLEKDAVVLQNKKDNTITPIKKVTNSEVEVVTETEASNKEQKIEQEEKEFASTELIDETEHLLMEVKEHNSLNLAVANTNLLKKETSLSGNAITKNDKKKMAMQFYVTPGISYRALYDGRDNSGVPFASQPGSSTNSNLSSTVFHKPASSIEVGLAWIRKIGSNVEFKAGAQANYNSYKVKATYTAATQLTSVSLSNNNGGNYQVNTSSNWSTADGAYPQWTENTNIQVAVPIGFNFILSQKSRTKFGIGVTAQPTYVIYNKSMLLSTDLKNYFEAPYLVNKTNLNAALEPFITVKGKTFDWQFGPQLRYQTLTTYAKKYPFKEHMFEYGFKVAIGKPF